MLSYRHAFHAGNHADVLKHIVLCLLLRKLTQKDKPFCVTDTHAAGGIYNLKQGYAAANAEYTTGISRIAGNNLLQELVPEYFEVIKSLNEHSKLKDKTALYPGSPFFEQKLTRHSDHINLCEIHPAELEALQQNFGRDTHITIQPRDGFEALNALLPPVQRRGLIFMDPSYEMKSDYIQVVRAVRHGLQKFATGIFAVWYPVLGRMHDHSKNLVQEMRRIGVPLLQAELRVTAQEDNRGMCGSGMLVVNYPYELYSQLEPIMGELYKQLCDADGAAQLKILVKKA